MNSNNEYFQKKSLKDYKKGQKIKEGMFIALRPRVKKSINVEDYFKILGKTLKKDIRSAEPLLKKYL